MKKHDRGWASLETGAALLIVMIIIAWGVGIWKDYIETKGWQTEARLVSHWASAARSYIGKNYTKIQLQTSTTTPVIITTAMLKNTGFLASGFAETNSAGQNLQAYVVRNAQNPKLLQAMVVSSSGTSYPARALIMMAKSITTGLGGYIQDGKTATGALRSWSVALNNYGAQSGNGHIAVLLSTDELSGAAEDTDRLYRFQVNGRPDLNKMHTSIDMESNNLNNAGTVNAHTGNFSGDVKGATGNFSGNMKGATVSADGRLYTGEYLQLEGTAVVGAQCSPNGLVGRDNTGALLSCKSSRWYSGNNVNYDACQWYGASAAMDDLINDKNGSAIYYKSTQCPTGFIMAGIRMRSTDGTIVQAHIDAYCCPFN